MRMMATLSPTLHLHPVYCAAQTTTFPARAKSFSTLRPLLHAQTRLHVRARLPASNLADMKRAAHHA
jgi:hypothetical protein